LVGFHSDFSILGTKPLLIKSHKSGTYIVNGCITFLKFIVLSFGLSTACYVFTKLTRLV
jgi:hypothetical protein